MSKWSTTRGRWLQRCCIGLAAFVLVGACARHDGPADGDRGSTIAGPLQWLAGDWSADAFDGRIAEAWVDDDNGLQLKTGFYIVGSDTPYAEVAAITSLAGQHCLIAKPQDRPIRIYDCRSYGPDSAVFTSACNTDPFEIRYIKRDDDRFDRVISSIHESDTVVYTFHFNRVK